MFNLNHCILLGLLLFSIGVYGVLSKRNILVILMSLEIMFNAVNLIIISFNYFNFYKPNQEIGHYFVLLIIAVAAAEAAVGLAILISIYRNKQNIDANNLSQLKG